MPSRSMSGSLLVAQIATKGTATIVAGNTSVVVAHGLAGTPAVVLWGPTNDSLGKHISWSADSTNITFTIDSAGGSDIILAWKAELTPVTSLWSFDNPKALIIGTVNSSGNIGAYDLEEVDTSGGNITRTPPAAASYPNIPFIVKKKTSDANTVTVPGIDGADRVLYSQYDFIKIVSNGTSWGQIG